MATILGFGKTFFVLIEIRGVASATSRDGGGVFERPLAGDRDRLSPFPAALEVSISSAEHGKSPLAVGQFERQEWAESARTGVAAGSTDVRAIAVVALRARKRLDRPERALIKAHR